MWPESEMVVLSASFASPGLVSWVRLRAEVVSPFWATQGLLRPAKSGKIFQASEE